MWSLVRCGKCGGSVYAEPLTDRVVRYVCWTGHWDQYRQPPQIELPPDQVGPQHHRPVGPRPQQRHPLRARINEIVALRRQGWSLQRLAGHYGLHPSSIQKWLVEWQRETGESLPWGTMELKAARLSQQREEVGAAT